MKKSFREAIENLKVSDLPAMKGPVVTVSSNDSLEEGFLKLSNGNVLSAPVFSEETKQYTGFLDMRDLVSSVVFISEQQSQKATKTLADLFVNAKWVGGAFSVTYLSRRNAFKSVSPSDPLIKVCEMLAARSGAAKLKRVAVVDAEGQVTAIISQSTLLSFVGKLISEHHVHSDKAIAALELGSAPVIALEESLPAIEAFRIMDSKRITGMAIVNTAGRLVGNISARDLKAFVKHIDFDRLMQPIGEFVSDLRKADLSDSKSPTISLFPDATFEHVVAKLVATRVHRIFVVDNEERYAPVRVISLVDILYPAIFPEEK